MKTKIVKLSAKQLRSLVEGILNESEASTLEPHERLLLNRAIADACRLDVGDEYLGVLNRLSDKSRSGNPGKLIQSINALISRCQELKQSFDFRTLAMVSRLHSEIKAQLVNMFGGGPGDYLN
jgi:hypothetical protein